MNNNLVLASSSPRREFLLNSLGLRFKVITPQIDETAYPGERPGEYARRMSDSKGIRVIDNAGRNSVIISADTVVALGKRIFTKPESAQEAFETLMLLSGCTHDVITAYTVLEGDGNILHRETCVSHVTFRKLCKNEIEGYVKTGEPMDKAGAYAVQGNGSFLIESIEGSYTNVIGLPLSNVLNALKSLKLQGL